MPAALRLGNCRMVAKFPQLFSLPNMRSVIAYDVMQPLIKADGLSVNLPMPA